MIALELMDRRSFVNKLDAFVAIASRKRPKASDEELAEYLQPVLEAALEFQNVNMTSGIPTKSVGNNTQSTSYAQNGDNATDADLAREMQILSRGIKPGSYEHTPADNREHFKAFCDRAKETPIGPEGIRMVALPIEYTVADLQEYLKHYPQGVGISENHTVTLSAGKDAWLVPVYA